MRQGIVREAFYLPPVSDQREAMLRAGCDDIREESGSDFVADRRIQRLLFQLSAGDEVIATCLGVLCRPQGRPAHVLRDLLESGVRLRLVGTAGERRLETSEEVIGLVSLLADHERGRGPARRKAVHQGGSRNPLSKYQVEYARRMYAEGESLRAIGLLFQLSPNHVLDVVSPPRARGAEADL